MITGGENLGRSMRKSEIFDLKSLRSCSLKHMKSERFQHVQVDNIVCGGGYDGATKKSCETFRNGEWHYSHTLLQNRSQHSVWKSPNGIILIGGEDKTNYNKTEMLRENGNSIESFTIDGRFAKYIHFIHFLNSFLFNLIRACSINLGKSVILTGGNGNLVREYFENGTNNILPKLNSKRYNHGCSSYIDSNDNEVIC